MNWTGPAVAFLAAAAAAPLVMSLLRRLGARQEVSRHVPEHAAKQGTPTMGGLIVLAGLLAGIVVGLERPAPLLVLLLGFAFTGFLDDYVVPKAWPGKRGLGWVPKLWLEGVSAVAAGLAAGISGPALALMVFVVLFASNAYNFSDGLDWLAGSIGLILAAGLAVVAWLLGTGDAVVLPLVVLCVSLLPFMVLNRQPAKVFLGDVGSLPIGALLGWCGFAIAFPGGTPVPAGIAAVVAAMVVLFLELAPVPLQIASAKLRKGKRLFPFRTPVHHAFQHAGWPEGRVVALFAGCQAACCLVAVAVAGAAR